MGSFESAQSRRHFLGSAAAAASAAVLGSSGNAQARPQYNLLFLWTDEQRADTMAAYGNSRIKTPNLNRLAAESVIFRNTYVTQPVCTPARSSVMSGLWPHTSGCTQNNVALPFETPAVPELVNDPYYRTAYIGKWHLGDEIFPQHGFEAWESIEDMYHPYYRMGRDENAKSSYCQWLTELGYEPDTTRGDFSRGFAANLPIEQSKTRFCERRACEFIERNQQEPFMLYVNFLEPHMPFTGPLNDRHSPDEVTLPESFNDPLEENEPELYRAAYDKLQIEGYGGFDLTKESDWRRLVANYWGLVSQVDESVGKILETLERLGLAENTIVVYTSDHGDMMGAHKLLTKQFMYEESSKVPWLMRLPGGNSSQHIGQPVSHIDLVPTLLDLMNVKPVDALPGQSLVPLFRGEEIVEDHVFIEWNPAGALAGGRNPGGSLRTTNAGGNATRSVVSPDGWKLCLNTHDRNQLFNLAEDPGELTNLFDADGYQSRIRELSRRIHAWQERVDDTVEIDA